MTPPCRTAAAIAPGPTASTIERTPARTRAASACIGSAPGITSQRCSTNTRRTSGSPCAERMRNSPPSSSPRWTSRRSSTTAGSTPVRAQSGAAVSAVRRSGVTNTAASASACRRAPTASACIRPSGDSGGSAWPPINGKGSSGTAAADAPWRIITISVASGGGTNGRCGKRWVMAGRVPAATRRGSAGGRGLGAGRAGRARRSGRARRARAARSGGGGRAPPPRRGGGPPPSGRPVDGAVLAGAVDVELAPVALDDEERLAVALAAGVVDEHPVARATDDLDVAMARDPLRALALRRVARGGGGGGGGGRRRRRARGGGRVVRARARADGGGVRRGERGPGRARGARGDPLGRDGGVGGGGDGVGHERGAGSVVSKERRIAPTCAAASVAPVRATASSVYVRPARSATTRLCTRPAAGRAKV